MTYRVLSQYRSELMGIAMLWVMLFHGVDMDIGVSLIDVVRALGFGGVDIFVLVSAMGLAMSLTQREQEYTRFLTKRAARVLPAYFVVMVPYTVFLILTGNAPWSALVWNSLLLYYWVRPAGMFNWYVSGIMTFYAITPFCVKKWKTSKHRIALTALGVVAALALCRLLIQDDFWSYLDVFYRFPIFFIGLLMGFFVQEERKLGWKDGLFWSVLFALGMVYCHLVRHGGVGSIYLPMCHLFVFTTVPFCLACCACFRYLPLGWLRRILRMVGENSLEIYLLNVSFFAQAELLRRVIPIPEGSPVFGLVLIVINVLVGILLHRGVEWMRSRFQVWWQSTTAQA